jgi:hypothetical protein
VRGVPPDAGHQHLVVAGDLERRGIQAAWRIAHDCHPRSRREHLARLLGREQQRARATPRQAEVGTTPAGTLELRPRQVRAAPSRDARSPMRGGAPTSRRRSCSGGLRAVPHRFTTQSTTAPQVRFTTAPVIAPAWSEATNAAVFRMRVSARAQEATCSAGVRQLAPPRAPLLLSLAGCASHMTITP